MKEKKQNKGMIVIIVILVLALLGTTGYIVYDKFLKEEVNVSKENKNNSQYENVEKEKEVTDSLLKEGLSLKIAMLEKISNTETEKYRSGYIYKKDISNSEINSDTKLYNVLQNLYHENEGLIPVTTNYDFKELEPYKSVATQIDVSLVTERYNDLYGERVVDHKNLDGCPMFIYDAENSKYYGMAECGGTSSTYLKSYNNKYTQLKDDFYVYVSVASITYNDQEGNSTVYTDYEMQNKYKDVTIAEVENIINSSNYKDFSEYKYTFTKNKNGNYIFSSIERVK